MAASVTETRSRVAEALGFWLVTLLICAVAGLASYKFGRDWIGDRLGGNVKPTLTTQELANRVSSGAQGTEPSTPDKTLDATPQPPPEKAVVDIKPTQATVQDKQSLRVDGQTSGDKPSTASQATDTKDSANSDAPSTDDDSASKASGASARAPHSDRAAGVSKPRAHEPSVPSKPPATAGGDRFTVRAGSFADRGNADRLVAKLRAQGYQPFVSRVMRDGREYHRVNVASVADRNEALKLRGELRAEGYAADVSGE
jgi:cell division protein FtsN